MELSERLLAWYDRHRRDLPWRRTRDPWAIWVSEVLLQQTRVEAAAPYFERFLARFPDPASLAAAEEQEVLALWSGLGYYQRARRLLRAAQQVTAAGGAIPASAAELEALPGVGRYTAAAVASIAFGERVPVVDGNVERVVSRRLALATSPAQATGRRRVAAAAAALLDPARPGDSNQALMELGATVCTPRRPGCPRCPLRPGCRAAAAGDPESFPVAVVRPAPRRERWTAALVADGAGRLLLARRSEEESLLAGMWELPTVRGHGARRAAAALAKQRGGRWTVRGKRLAIRHAITVRALEIHLREATWSPGGVAERSGLVWVSPEEAPTLPLTGATRKLLAALTAAA